MLPVAAATGYPTGGRVAKTSFNAKANPTAGIRNYALQRITANPFRTAFQPRASLLQLVEELVSEGLPVLESRLSSSVKIRESHQHATPMIQLDPRHKLAQEYVALHRAGWFKHCRAR